MTLTQHTEPDLQAMVDELVRVHTRREPYIVRTAGISVGFIAHHTARVPALIDQLLEPAPGGTGELSGSTAGSRPAVRVEALDTIALISDEAGEWIDQMGGVIPCNSITGGRTLPVQRGSGAKRTLVTLRALHAGLTGSERCGRMVGGRFVVEIDEDPEFDSKDSHLAPDESGPKPREWCCTSHHIEADVRSWWRQARIIAGWDSPTYRPRATCPVCSNRSGLRINLGAHTGVCVECRTVWEPATIGLLAEHIRREVEGETQADDEELELLDTPESA